jgi:hypothetical protein
LTVGAASLGAGAYAALGRVGSLELGDGEDSWWNRGSVALEHAAMREWSGRVGQAFAIGSGGAGGSYKLARVEALESKGVRPPEVARRSAFLLVFEGDGQAAVEGDRTYNVSHSGGKLDIFFDSADARTPNLLTAVFN